MTTRLYGAKEAAVELKISRRYVTKLAETYKVGQVIGGTLVLQEEELEILKKRTPQYVNGWDKR